MEPGGSLQSHKTLRPVQQNGLRRFLGCQATEALPVIVSLTAA
jgi:hypothetical protein